MLSSTPDSYLVMAEKALNDAAKAGNHYLHESTKAKLAGVVVHELLEGDDDLLLIAFLVYIRTSIILV